VPHPELIRRSFVLVPLVELDPGLVHPETGESLLNHLARLHTRPPVRKGSRLWN
jgi:2-amino-4-hydroxy-6-hydroxymethyldihydropteridine diphosphokinase